MSFSFTETQRQAIESRGRTLLVSAAAGSGKTRVLTERLLRYVSDPERPADIDRFLVITYTRAAASELRARILAALTGLAAEHPLDTRLRRQQSLCCRAPIGTIHSYCTSLLREYSHLLGLSPAFTVLEEERAEALKAAVASRVLDARYERIGSDPDFRLLADTVGAGRDDRRLQSTLLELYEKLRAHPYPEDWAAEQAMALDAEGITDAGDTVWGREILSAVRSRGRYWAEAMDEAAADILAAGDRMSGAYGDRFQSVADQLRDFCRAAGEGWNRAQQAADITFPRLGSLRNYDDPARQERMKLLWGDCKKACEGFAKALGADSDTQLRDLRRCAPAMKALLGLTLELDRAYAAEKQRRDTLDFSDLEHFAARLLVDKATSAPTWVAAEQAGRFTEIMVDEYQDVNAVQELIFRAVSRQERNLFLVGDVKQSIYRFRLADPGLFLEKYNRFAPLDKAAPGEPARILLQENFRSRAPILEAANLVMGSIMSRTLGELDYDSAAALRFGAPGFDPALDVPAEMHLIDPETEEDSPEAARQEAEFVARRILAMVQSKTPVTENGVTRPCGWGDFVLLLRGTRGNGKTFHRALARYGIPVAGQPGGDFFTALEVSVTIDLLAVIDNPHADVPLISVLRSPAFGFTPEELSAIRTADRNSDFYGALCAAAAAGNERCAGFLARLADWRALAPELAPEALVWQLCSDTGLFAVCAAMSDGETRRRNLLRLFELAHQFAGSGSRGLYRFVRWLRKLAEKGMEQEAPVQGQAVRIMTIHKSKGLEFPFVFLCDLSHRFNTMDTRACVPVHSVLGLGPKVVDRERGIEYPGLARRAVEYRLTTELLSEEMRVLYVAMTRAKEKLIMTAVKKKADEALCSMALKARTPLPPEILRGASSFADWILLSALTDPAVLPVTVHHGPEDFREADPGTAAPPEEIGAAAAVLRERLDFRYPFAGAADLPSKLTATEIKDIAAAPEDPEAAALTEREPALRFRRALPGRSRTRLSAAERGTATHSFLQYVDFAKTGSLPDLQAEGERLVAAERLTAEELAAIDLEAVRRLFAAPLGQAMARAEALHREFRFLLLSPAGDYFAGTAPEDQLLLQGVVDCCFRENGGITLVDYKTDRVTPAQVPDRAETYRPQLTAYAGALERIFGLPVKRCVLWFLHCGTEFALK